MENIDKAIELNDKKTQLLKELKEAMIAEKCDVIVDNVPKSETTRDFYMVFDRVTGALKTEGTKQKVEQWIQRKNIKAYWRK